MVHAFGLCKFERDGIQNDTKPKRKAQVTHSQHHKYCTAVLSDGNSVQNLAIGLQGKCCPYFEPLATLADGQHPVSSLQKSMTTNQRTDLRQEVATMDWGKHFSLSLLVTPCLQIVANLQEDCFCRKVNKWKTIKLHSVEDIGDDQVSGSPVVGLNRLN